MDRTRLFLIIWTALLFVMLMNNSSTPGKLNADQQLIADAAAPATGPVSTGEPLVLANENLKVRIDPDGSLTSARVLRYDEEILEHKMHPGEVVSIWRERRSSDPIPVYSAGIFVAKPPHFISDNRRKHLGASSEKTANGGDFANVDTEGKALPKGLAVEKSWKLDPKRFVLDLDVTLKNTSKDLLDLSKTPAVHVFAGPVLAGDRVPPEVVYFDGEKAPEPSMSTAVSALATGVKWIGVRNNYYTLVLDHQQGAGNFVHQQVAFQDLDGKQHQAPIVGFKLDVPFIKQGASVTWKFKVYIGPKIEAELGTEYIRAFDNWDGWIGFISHLMFWVLQFFYKLTSSYGFAILALTFCVKAALHPWSLTVAENQAKMQAMQPKIQEIKDRYKDNPEQMNIEMMKLYKEGYNPAAGCLPMLIQMPVFISLYNSLQYAIELKGVGFWWMADLSKPDTTTVLALLFALSVYYNGKLMAQKQSQTATAAPPAGADQDMQVVMNRMMPIMMYGMFVMMPVPGGVMIYLATQSLLGLIETRHNMTKLSKKSGKRNKS